MPLKKIFADPDVSGDSRPRRTSKQAKAEAAKAVKPLSRVKTKVQKEKLIADRHRQIVDAAIQVFEVKGFHGATLRDVGRAANLPQGTIYNYVETKEDILFLVCDRIVSDYLARVRQALETTSDPTQRLRSIMRAIAHAMIDHQVEIRILYREDYHLSPEAGREIRGRIAQFVSEVEQAITAISEGKDYTVRFVCNIVTFLPTMFALRDWVTPRGMPEEQQVHELVEFMARGLGLED